ncbi:uncharacterized protein BKCO1_5800055 [Diplodia corticola]|uniref:Uncharacterized protein n=1 Tax=Diplodia corticola TaxID=236234 RepID=A0A1J9QQ83_9PEZI|nr:uncharacterized protein BKCO1_5800055 [Diplodia corticola]OJD30624.1 hypothetical protein BKCO1_5800055 [Diplodia corticola]
MPSADSNPDAAVSFAHTTSALTSSQTAQLTAALFSANSIPRIQAALQHSLQETGWTHALRAHVLNLLRSGECGSYDELMARVLDDTRQAGDDDNNKDDGGEKKETNGHAAANGDNKNKKNGTGGANNGGGAETGAARTAASIRIPDEAVRQGVKAVRKEVETVCEITFD